MIYIATHKKFEPPNLENYCPLQLGVKGISNWDYLTDNTGENISSKNPSFCELTGLYWVWKNAKDEYKGLVHYRRFFGKISLSKNIKNIYTYSELVAFLDKTDIILPYIEYFKQNAKEEILIDCCTPEIFSKMEIILKAKYPKYAKTFDEYFQNNKSVLFNMMFCKKEIFDEYCSWLFDILFELEKEIDISILNSYQKRIYGFLSERLLNIWVKKNNLVVKNLPVINTEMKGKDLLKLILRREYHKLTF